ncbi:MAG TPA: AraC family transcriptional regulator [Thermoanaerobaculia bacterium]|jgi:AraC-like DNA-binding protein
MTTTETSIRPTPRTPLPEAVAREVREQLQRDLDRVSDDVRPLVELIAQRLFSPDFDANVLKRRCAPSRRTLKRFREQLGATPWVYVTERRMAAAERLLATTDLEVWQVAEAVGSRRRTFSVRFKRVRGRSPREVRAAAGRGRASPSEPRAATQRLDGRASVPRKAPSPPPTSGITLTVVEPAGAGSPVRRRTLYFYDASRASFVSCRDLLKW